MHTVQGKHKKEALHSSSWL